MSADIVDGFPAEEPFRLGRIGIAGGDVAGPGGER